MTRERHFVESPPVHPAGELLPLPRAGSERGFGGDAARADAMMLVAVPEALEAVLRQIARETTGDPHGADEGLQRQLGECLTAEYDLEDGSTKRRGVPPSLLAAAAPHIRRIQGKSRLVSLLRGARLIFPVGSDAGREEDGEDDAERQRAIKERRRHLLLKREQKEYQRMTSNVTENAREGVGGDIQASVKFQAAIGANMVLAVLSAFILSYWASKYLVGTNNKSHRLAVGLLGAVFILLVEMLVFVVRSLKADEATERALQASQANQTQVGVPRAAGGGRHGGRTRGEYELVQQAETKEDG